MDEDLFAALRAKDFHIPDFIADGQIHRFSREGSKDSGWYIAWENRKIKTGDIYYACLYGDWRTSEINLYRPGKLSRADNKHLNEQIKANQIKAQKEREIVNEQAAAEAQRIFAAAKKHGHTPYMMRKLIPDLYETCIYNEQLQVPMRDVDGFLWSLQTIYANGEKQFMSGGRAQGCLHIIGEPIKDQLVYVVEGFATGASVHQATGNTVAVAFSAGNLLGVTSDLLKQYPLAQFKVCGDFDEAGAGQKAAKKVTEITSCPSVIVDMKGKRGSDFNDLHAVFGLDEVKRQIEKDPVKPRKPLAQSEGDEKPKKGKGGILHMKIADAFRHDQKASLPYPDYDLRVYQTDSGDKVIFEVDENNVAHERKLAYVVNAMATYRRENLAFDSRFSDWIHRDFMECARLWLAETPPQDKPQPFGFRGDETVCFQSPYRFRPLSETL